MTEIESVGEFRWMVRLGLRTILNSPADIGIWLGANMGPPGVRYAWARWGSTDWVFASKEDAMLFEMTWA